MTAAPVSCGSTDAATARCTCHLYLGLNASPFAPFCPPCRYFISPKEKQATFTGAQQRRAVSLLPHVASALFGRGAPPPLAALKTAVAVDPHDAGPAPSSATGSQILPVLPFVRGGRRGGGGGAAAGKQKKTSKKRRRGAGGDGRAAAADHEVESSDDDDAQLEGTF